MQKKYKILLTLPAIILTFTLFILSSFPQLPHIDLGFEWEDKIFHFIAFYIYGVSLILAVLINIKKFDKKRVLILVVIIGAVYGITDELHQYFVPGRDCDFFDWLADFTGVITSLFLFNYIKNKIFSFRFSNTDIK
ncbi:MAG: VanZ family protein [Bacteroidota bacterium]|jgi:hypothetical protein